MSLLHLEDIVEADRVRAVDRDRLRVASLELHLLCIYTTVRRGMYAVTTDLLAVTADLGDATFSRDADATFPRDARGVMCERAARARPPPAVCGQCAGHGTALGGTCTGNNLL